MSTNYARVDNMEAAVLASAIMDLAWGMQDETSDHNDSSQRKIWASLELIRHSAATLLDYLNAQEVQNCSLDNSDTPARM